MGGIPGVRPEETGGADGAAREDKVNLSRPAARALWVIAVLGLGIFLFWGGRHAYCHFRGGMPESNARGKAAGNDLPLFVSVVKPVRRAAIRSLTLPATVEAFEKATLYAKVSGYLARVKVDIGDRVEMGEVLAVIDVPEIEQEHRRAQAAVREAQAAEERAQADASLKALTYQRLSGIRQSQPDVISEQEVDEARAALEVAQSDFKLARARLELARSEVARLEVLEEYAKIKTPYDGVVTARFIDPGGLIQASPSSEGPGAAILTVMAMDRVRVYVNVPEPAVPYLHRGDSAQVELAALPGKPFSGRVERFATALDQATRTMKTEIDLRNPSHVIRPGMYGSVILKLDEEAGALFLPAESVRQTAEGRKYVYTVAEGRIQIRTVETGLDDGKMIQVIGLQGEEDVVLGSSRTLREGLPVEVARASS